MFPHKPFQNLTVAFHGCYCYTLLLHTTGHFGKVMLAMRKDTAELIALKEIRLTKTVSLTSALTERVLLASLPDHPFVISLRLSFRAGNFLYYGFEFMAGADLFELIRRKDIRVDAQQASFYAAQVLLALEHLHR
jgi:serine/threonine protein kinase